LALYTPAYGSRTDASSRVELSVRATGAVGALNRPADLQMLGLRTGAGAIPADGAVLSADGAAAQQLRDLWARTQARTAQPRGRLLVSSPTDAQFSLGVEPVVLRDSRRALPWTDPNLINPRQPHTLVGWNEAGETFLVAVDGRQAGSEGMTMAEAADFLLALGATQAVSLDGGGGTTFVAGGSVWNRPSDNDPARPSQYSERGTANALLVMARPGAPLPPPAPPAPKPVAPRPGTPGATAPGAGGSDGAGNVMPWDVDPADGTRSPGVTTTGPGSFLADGELPVGSSTGARWASGSGNMRLSEPGLTPSADAPGDPAATAAPAAADPHRSTGRGAPASRLTGQPDEVVSLAASTRLGSPALKAAAGGALALLAVLVLRGPLWVWRRRRLHRFAALIEDRGGEPWRREPRSGQDDEVVPVDDLVGRPLGQVAGS
jgi:hypothetical protein